MYDYHYNVMQKHYGDNIKLMYTDTGELIIYFTMNLIFTNKLIFIDSLVCNIETEDFYDDVRNNPILLDRLDTADLHPNHPFFKM